MASATVWWFINDAFGKEYISFSHQTFSVIRKKKNNCGNQNVQICFRPRAVLDCLTENSWALPDPAPVEH